MSKALSPGEAAAGVLWLATLPAGTREPYGELVQHRKVLPLHADGLGPTSETSSAGPTDRDLAAPERPMAPTRGNRHNSRQPLMAARGEFSAYDSSGAQPTVSTALPEMRRWVRAVRASRRRVQVLTRPTAGSSRPAATSPARVVRSGPGGSG